MSYIFSFLSPALCLMFSPLIASSPAPPQDASWASVEPASAVAGHYGTWRVQVVIPEPGLETGGMIRVQLPDSWHSGARNSAKPLQATNPMSDHYISARAANPGVILATSVESETDQYLVKSARTGLDGRHERYIFVVRVEILEGELEPGDRLTVLYGDTSEGSRGMRAPFIKTRPEPVLVEITRSEDGIPQVVEAADRIRVRPGPPAKIRAILPSYGQAGERVDLHLAVLDEHSNLVEDYQESIEIRALQGEAEIETSYEVEFERGWGKVPIRLAGEGVLRLFVSTMDELLETRTNPTKILLPGEEEPYLLWGDLHSHSDFSWDGVGQGSFEYARGAAGLDFYALTDHSRSRIELGTRGLGPHVWEEYNRLTDEAHIEGEFVTLHAYEISLGAPYGHHNVFFRGEPGRLVAAEEATLKQLWSLLERGEALTIPHHTGKFPSPVNWQIHDPELRRNLEIYSAHGLSETFDPDHPLAFEKSEFTSPSRSLHLPQFAQDAWIEGLRLSTVAASDDHRAQPGQEHWGLTAVRARTADREGVFDALYERRTYGTTGSRTLLNFRVGGIEMGQAGEVRGQPRLDIEVHGTREIARVEVLRYSAHDGGFRVIFRLEPRALDLHWSNIDGGFAEDSIYYVRLREEGRREGRPIMAWSSPIWVMRGDE